MPTAVSLRPSDKSREAIRNRGGLDAWRCYQCGTCSAACELADGDLPFPRRQMNLAQWGLVDRLAADPAVWLCHQCQDCTLRCPRDAKPGEVLRTIRAMVIERLAVPSFMGKLVGRAAVTWPILLGVPILFWVVLLAVTGHLGAPQAIKTSAFAFHDIVPWGFLYVVYTPVAVFVAAALFLGGLRFWRGLEGAEKRSGSFWSEMIEVIVEICTHKRFSKCSTARSRSWSHFLLVWGFVGAAVTSGLLIVSAYILKEEMPLALYHPWKILGNLSAVLLVVGALALLYNRLAHAKEAGGSTAFDHFFLGVVVLVVVSGVLIEGGRLSIGADAINAWLYIVHLGAVLCLFITTPYSKFAHLMYRTLAMVHERMVKAGQKDATQLS